MDETVPLRYAEVYVDADSKLAGMTCAQIKMWLIYSMRRTRYLLMCIDTALSAYGRGISTIVMA